MSTFLCFGFQGCWEQNDNAWRYFQRKILNKISVERLIFCKSDTSLKLPAKAGQNRGVAAPPKPLH